MVVFGLGKDFLFKSVLGRCDCNLFRVKSAELRGVEAFEMHM